MSVEICDPLNRQVGLRVGRKHPPWYLACVRGAHCSETERPYLWRIFDVIYECREVLWARKVGVERPLIQVGGQRLEPRLHSVQDAEFREKALNKGQHRNGWVRIDLPVAVPIGSLPG